MPRATVSQDTVRRELVSCPGGFVELRTLSFHEMNMRSDIAARMYQEQQVTRRGQKSKPQESVKAFFEIMNVAVTEFEFRNCITDHNLEDENGGLIDFTRPMQAWRLDPKIGAEIGKYIDELNQPAEDDDLVPLEMQPSSFSSDEKTTPLHSVETE